MCCYCSLYKYGHYFIIYNIHPVNGKNVVNNYNEENIVLIQITRDK